MNKFETLFRNELHRLLARYGAKSRIMHGTIYQPGIPDALIGDRKKGLTLVELKVDCRVEVPTRSSVIGQLEGAQVVFINDMFALQTPRVFVASRHYSTSKVYVCTFDSFLEFNNINLFVGWLLG